MNMTRKPVISVHIMLTAARFLPTSLPRMTVSAPIVLTAASLTSGLSSGLMVGIAGFGSLSVVRSPEFAPDGSGFGSLTVTLTVAASASREPPLAETFTE